MVVIADTGGGYCGNERALDIDTLQGRLQIVDIALQRRFALVADRADTIGRIHRHHGAREHRAGEIVFVIFREGRNFRREQILFFVRSDFESVEAFLDIGKEAGLRYFAVGDDVDPEIGLLFDDFGHPLGDLRLVGVFAEITAGELRLHGVEHFDGARQAADMGCQNSVFIAFA